MSNIGIFSIFMPYSLAGQVQSIIGIKWKNTDFLDRESIYTPTFSTRETCHWTRFIMQRIFFGLLLSVIIGRKITFDFKAPYIGLEEVFWEN